eukprot:1160825-Pelagomonas_calceolata.AAC.4
MIQRPYNRGVTTVNALARCSEHTIQHEAHAIQPFSMKRMPSSLRCMPQWTVCVLAWAWARSQSF